MTASASTAVRLHDQRLNVSAFTTNDATVIAAAETALELGQDLDEWFSRVLAIGAGAMMSAGSSLDIARVDRALERLESQMGASLESAVSRLGASVERATHPETGEMARAAQGAVDRLATGVQRVLTGPDALLPEAAGRAVAVVTDRALQEEHRLMERDRQQLTQLVACDRDRVAVEIAKAVAAHTGDFATVMNELRGLLANRETEQARQASGPRKGLAYEQAVHAAIHDAAAAAGDGGADFTGSTAGADGSRKGDTVVILRSLPGQLRRLVVEAKNRPGRPYSISEWARELELAQRARQADVAIGVCPPDQMPGSAGVLVLDSRRIIVGWTSDQAELLGSAYLLMRMAAGQRTTANTAEQTEELMRTLVRALDPLSEIQKQAKACTRASDKIAAIAAGLREDFASRIDSVDETGRAA